MAGLEALYERFTERNKRYGDYQGIFSLAFDSVEKLVVKDIDSDFKYIHATVVCSSQLVLVCESYSEYTNPVTGEYDFDQSIDLDSVEVGLKVELSFKKTSQGNEDLQVNSINFI